MATWLTSLLLTLAVCDRSDSSDPMGQTLSSPTASNDAPIFSLPAALVQSVMHFCSVAEIFSLARCSTRLYRDGGDPFAWKHVMISITADRAQPQPSLLQRMFAASKHALSISTYLRVRPPRSPVVRRPLLAHARVSVNWPIRGNYIQSPELHEWVLRLLDRIPSVHTFSSTLVFELPPVSLEPTILAEDAFCLVLRHPAIHLLASLQLYVVRRPGYTAKPLFDAIRAPEAHSFRSERCRRSF